MKNKLKQHPINLLPRSQKNLNFGIYLLQTITKLLIVIFILGFLTWLGALGYKESVSKSLGGQKNELVRLNKLLNEFKNLEETIALINEREQTGKTLTSKLPDWQAILGEVSTLTQPSIKLSKLTIQEDIKKPWQLDGAATSARELSIFQAKLESSKFFENIFIDKTGLQNPLDSNSIINFSISFNLSKK